MRPLLYTYRRCPYAMRARMALLLGGVAFDACEIVLRDKPQALLDASPKGTVPVLLPGGAPVIEQSWHIVAWALTHPAAGAEARDAWRRACSGDNPQWLERNDTRFKFSLDRYKYPERFTDASQPTPADVRSAHLQQCLAGFLQPLEQRLTASRFLGGATPCATDIGIVPFVRQFAAIDPGQFAGLALPHTQAWLSFWQNSALFAAAMVKWPANTLHTFTADTTHARLFAPSQSAL